MAFRNRAPEPTRRRYDDSNDCDDYEYPRRRQQHRDGGNAGHRRRDYRDDDVRPRRQREGGRGGGSQSYGDYDHYRGGARLLVDFYKDDAYETVKLSLRQDVLNSVMKTCQNLPLCVISNVGASRSGRSFLMCLLKNCLEGMETGDTNWVHNRVDGFEWSSGIKPKTDGIYIWPRAFILNVDEGEVAVLLIDTPGIHDEITSPEELSTILGLSLFTSSVVIMNVCVDIPQGLFRWLQPFFEFGNYFKKEVQEEHAFQKLALLVRDWTQLRHHDYGDKGGKDLLKYKLRQQKQEVQESLKDHFEEVTCFLAPHIGEAGLHDGTMSEQFQKEVTRFIKNLVRYEMIQSKKSFGGCSLSPNEFAELLESYVKLFNDNNRNQEEVDPKDLLHASLDLSTRAVVGRAMDAYHIAFDKRIKLHDQLSRAHDLGKKAAEKVFSESNLVRGFQNKCDMLLQSELKKAFESKTQSKDKERNRRLDQCRRKSEEMFNNILADFLPLLADKSRKRRPGDAINFYEDDIIENAYKKASDKAVSLFTENFDDDDEYPENEVTQLEGDFRTILDDFRKVNDAERNRANIIMDDHLNQLVNFYKDDMRRQNSKRGTDMSQFERNHQTSMDMVQDKFREFGKPGSKQYQNEYKSKLDEQIQEEYQQFRFRLQGELDKNVAEANRLIKMEVEQYEQKLSRKIEDDADESELQAFHRSTMPRIVESFENQISIPANSPQANDLVSRLQELLQSAYKRQVEEGVVVKRRAEEKLQLAANEAFQLYSKEMKKVVDDATNEGALLPPDQLEQIHASISSKSLEDFEEATENIPNRSRAAPQQFAKQLQNRMNDMFQDIQKSAKQAEQVAHTEAERLVSDCYREYKDKMDESMSRMNNKEELARRHGFILKEICQRFRSRCSVKDDNFVANHISNLQDKVEQAFGSFGNDFKNVKVNEGLLTHKAVFEAQQYYNREMANICGTARNTKKMINPKDLHDIHLKQSEAAIRHAESQNPGLTEGQRRKVEQELVIHYQKYKEVNDMVMGSEDEPAIGIDLGTTYCCVAVYYGGEVKIIPNSIGANTTPSYVAFDDDGNVMRIGQSAKDNAFRNPETTIFDAKRIIGRKMNDEQLRDDMQYWPFELVEENGVPAIEIGDRTFPPEQISAHLLKHLKETAEQFLNKQVKKAVITVPAYFNDGQRQATVDAGRIADLKVLTILNEPTAAAIAYKQQRFNDDAKNVLIFDFGGGTFDVAVLDMSGNNIKVLAVDGDTHLGGEDFDKNMMKHCAKEFEKDADIDLFQGRDSNVKQERDQCRQRLRRVQTHCENSKKDLTTAISTEVTLDSICQGEDLSVRITRKQFEDMNLVLFEKSIRVVDKVLSESGVSISKIDDVVLIGGSTKILKLQQMLSDHFGGRALFSAINPDEAVAYGAAVQAAILNGKDARKKFNFGEVRDVIPISIGIEVATKEMDILIPKNTPIPTEHRDEYRTFRDNQDSVQIRVFQGENSTAAGAGNTMLGEFTLNGIPPGPKGEEVIEVVMYIDAMGILHVTATCKSNMQEQKLSVTEKKDRLSDETIEKLKNEGNRPKKYLG